MMNTHKSRFEKYRDDAFVLKATQYAKWTLPQLMASTSERAGVQQQLERDYQMVGALLLNNLSSKLASLLFPTNRPFFKIAMSRSLREHARKSGVSDTELQGRLARKEMDACQRLFHNASYAQLVLAMKFVIATGNALLFRDMQQGRSVAYSLQNFAVRRDGHGNLLDCVLREKTYMQALPPDLQEQLRIVGKEAYKNPDKEVDLFTRIERQYRTEGGVTRTVYAVSQEVDSTPVGAGSVYPEHECPWHVITWSLIPGEHYGRGLVEDYAGGFARLSDLSEALSLYEVSAMKVLNLVGPGSGADIDEMANAESGEYVQAGPESVRAHEAGEAQKIAEVRADIAEVFQMLAKAFMYSGNTRDAERVTAVELRMMAEEAERTLGGNYSTLAENTQIPLAYLLLLEDDADQQEGLVTGAIKPTIMAGIPALGRAADVQNLLLAAQELGAILPVLAQMDQRIDLSKVADLVYGGRSVDTSVLFKSDEQLAEEQAAAEQQQQGQEQMMQAASAADQADQMQALNEQQF